MLLLIAATAWTLAFGDGAEEGRRGNALFREGEYAAAAEAYRAGLDALEDDEAALASDLWSNLGAALFRQEKYAEALAAFKEAASAAATSEDRLRALYNAGLGAAATGEREAALGYFRQTLLLDPEHENARFNYEFVKRQMQSRPQQSQPPEEPVQPSDYARRLKEQADALVAEDEYLAAARLMARGLQRDSTVRAYGDFIGRVTGVAQIDTATFAPAP